MQRSLTMGNCVRELASLPSVTIQHQSSGTDHQPLVLSDRLSWYHDRVQDVVLKAREVFPSTSLKWVTSTFRKCFSSISRRLAERSKQLET